MSETVKFLNTFRDSVLRLDGAVASLISRDTEDANLRDARCLLTSSLMRAVGISRFLGFEPDESREGMIAMRKRIHEAFGAPGDWSGQIGEALRSIYHFDI